MEVLFIEGAQGPLFSVFHRANSTVSEAPGLVYIPPFAEEMNCSRRMAALQARRLAAQGFHVLLLDLFGTGDSGGEFRDAEWQTWCDDVKAAIVWLAERAGGKVGLWGLRLGALLAAEVASIYANPIAPLVLWQPVITGERYLTQFLRLRLAASLKHGSDRETTKDLRTKLLKEKWIEVAGYQLSASLANDIAARNLESFLRNARSSPLIWLEVTSVQPATLAVASQEIVRAIDKSDRTVVTSAVTGEPFWSTQETTIASNLLRATEDCLRT